jgi:hypothetical protein
MVAREHAVRLLRDANWTDRDVWVGNRFQMRRLLGLTASTSTDDEVRKRIATAVAAEQPELLEPILVGISQKSEQRDRTDWRLLGVACQREGTS